MSEQIYRVAKNPQLKKLFQDIGFRIEGSKHRTPEGVKLSTTLINPDGTGKKHTKYRATHRKVHTTTTFGTGKHARTTKKSKLVKI